MTCSLFIVPRIIEYDLVQIVTFILSIMFRATLKVAAAVDKITIALLRVDIATLKIAQYRGVSKVKS